MTHDPAATLGSDPSAAPVEDTSTALTRPESRSDFLDRARRILGGDVRPDDYLPVTPEARAVADFELNYYRTQMKLDVGPEEAARQLRGWVLSFHHGGENIDFIEDDTGIIVLAVGLDQIGALVRGLPDELLNGLCTTCPEPF